MSLHSLCCCCDHVWGGGGVWGRCTEVGQKPPLSSELNHLGCRSEQQAPGCPGGLARWAAHPPPPRRIGTRQARPWIRIEQAFGCEGCRTFLQRWKLLHRNMIRGKKIINPARSRSWVRTALLSLPVPVFREICLPVSLVARGAQPIPVPYPDPELNIAWWNFFFFFLNCVTENRFLVSFFSLLNPILSGFGLSNLF